MAWAMAINSTSTEEFSVQTLEDQLKSLCCIYYMISKVFFPWSLCQGEIGLSKENRGNTMPSSFPKNSEHVRGGEYCHMGVKASIPCNVKRSLAKMFFRESRHPVRYILKQSEKK